jgi:tyrosyl-tRNA synthetase
MDGWEGSQLNDAKDILAYELTKLVHGEEEAEKARTASKALFAGGSDDSTMPTFTILDEHFADDKIAILDLLTVSKLTPSKSEARRLVMQGGVLVNDEKVTSIDTAFTKEQFSEKFIVKKGKKTFLKIVK